MSYIYELLDKGGAVVNDDPDKAVLYYQEALLRAPADGEVWLRVGQGCFQMQRYVAAMLAATRASGNGITLKKPVKNKQTISDLYGAAQIHLNGSGSFGRSTEIGKYNTLIDNDVVECQVVPSKPNGDCGLTAIYRYLALVK